MEPGPDAHGDSERGGEPGRPVRRRRRAVGPAGATPPGPVDAVVALEADDARARQQGGERPSPDDDERLRRDVPPHHGG